MADNQGSARVTLREIDLSQVRDQEVLPQGVPAAVVGPAKRGPAFVPKTFANTQQFGDIFGSLSEVSQDSNANLFGPLAINEWMRNAQAGAYVRVLGVGDGDGTLDSNKKTQGAGFIVGDSVSYDGTDLTDNQHAAYESGPNAAASKTAAKDVGRTHFLGCFMKDAAGSEFLKDAGLQSSNVSSRLKITLGDELPSNDDFILIKAVGESDIKWLKFIFLTGSSTITPEDLTDSAGTESDPHEISVGINGLDIDGFLSQLEKAFSGQSELGIAFPSSKILSSNYLNVITKDLVSNFIEISHVGTGESTNTSVKYFLNTDTEGSITLSSLGNSSSSGTDLETQLALGPIYDTPAVAEIVTLTISGNPLNDDTIVITDILGNDLTIRIDTTQDSAAARDNTQGNVVIGISNQLGNNTNIAGRIAEAITFGRAAAEANQLDGQGDPTYTFVNNNNGTLTITSSLKGAITNFVNVSDIDNTSSTVDTTGSNITENSTFFLEFDISDTLIGNEFSFDFKSLNTATDTTVRYKFVEYTDGTVNGTLVSGYYQIEIDNTNQVETVNRIQDVLRDTIGNSQTDQNIRPFGIISDAVQDESNIYLMYLSLEAKTNSDVGNFFSDSIILKIKGSPIKASFNGTRIDSSFGIQQLNLTGGSGSAIPVIRGLLMTPQGVKATLDVTDGTYTSVSTTDADARKSVTSEGTLRNFGGTEASDLIGYELGKVDNNSFTVLLNGFSNTDHPAVLTCSFDPESVNYFAKVLNTDPEKIEECGHYLYAHWDVDPDVSVIDVTGVYTSTNTAASSETAAFCLPSQGSRNTETADSPNFEGFDTRFRTAKSPWIMSQKFGGQTKKLFRLHAQDDGAIANDRFRILISDLRLGSTASEWATFSLSLESFDSDPVKGESIVSWKNLTLDPDHRNFIGRVIGNKNVYYDFKKGKLVEDGDFELRNKYVWVEMSEELMSGDLDYVTLPCGFSEYVTLNTGYTGLFDESGTNGSGESRLLLVNTLENLEVLPLPFVKTLTRQSGVSVSPSSDLAWGVKFAKKENGGLHKELGEIRLNPSIRSWTKFYPDMGTYSFSKLSSESFSLENIFWDGSDWASAVYERSGSSDNSNLSAFDISTAAKGGNVKFLKFRCLMQGGFDGLNIFNKEKAALSTVAAHREANEEVVGSNKFTGPTVESYKRAIDVLSDKSATEIQLLAIPGIREPLVTDYAITACESRFDAMLVMDIQESDKNSAVITSSDIKPHVGQTITTFENRGLDTSFAAAYFPDVISRRSSNNTPIQVPPSVCILGVMSQNDTLADPWFAPAGLTRGRLNASNAKVQMNRDLLNDLYDADINPIYVPSGRTNEVYAFGQKTLLQNQSALDRINVRRLLINIRRRVKAVANTLLFEPNRASTLNRFSSLVEPIMSEVQARQGVERYKVQIDTSTTTQNDIENNTIRGKVYLQPTKSVEFISLDFVVTNSID